jgi:Ca2+:H+ antiporter
VLLAAGSSTQVGVLVVPFCVVLAWMMGQPLDLNLFEFEALVLFISVLLAAVVVQVRWDFRFVSSTGCDYAC